MRAASVALAVAALVAMALTYRSTPPVDLSEFGFADDMVKGEVVTVEEAGCGGVDDNVLRCWDVVFRVGEGPARGTFVYQTFPVDPLSPEFAPGDRVRLSYAAGSPVEYAFAYADRERLGVLVGWGMLFGVAVVALGRWKGVAALIGIGSSIAVILGYILPSLLGGAPPVLVAVVGASVIAFVTIWLTHGVTAFSAVALFGTVGTLAVVALLSDLAFGMARITGLSSEEATYLTLIPGVDIAGLVLAGAVLGALGALDDVTVTQASAVWEVRSANPSMAPPDLMAAGLRVGRDHIASTVNTLVLAYAGASMPLLVLFVLSGLAAGDVVNSEVVAVELVRTVVGSLGLVAAVPLTTWLASRVAHGLPPRPGFGHSH